MSPDRTISRLHLLGALLVAVALTCGTAFGAECPWLNTRLSASRRNQHVNLSYNGRLADGETVFAILRFSTQSGCTVTGVWMDSMWFRMLRIRGRVSRDGTVRLNLIGVHNRRFESLSGRFFPLRFYLPAAHPSDPALGVLVGSLAGSAIGQEVYLRSATSWTGSINRPYSSATLPNAAKFDGAALRFWRAVRDHDVAAVAKSVSYPLPVTVSYPTMNRRRPYRKFSLVIKSPAMLKRNYNKVFNWYMRDGILGYLPLYLSQTYTEAPGRKEFTSGLAVRVGFSSTGRVIWIGS